MKTWIAITDKLPECGAGVLITDGEIVTAAQRYTIRGREDRLRWTFHEQSGYECEFDFVESRITHWMPLPDPSTTKGP